jgi:hypothetical protein
MITFCTILSSFDTIVVSKVLYPKSEIIPNQSINPVRDCGGGHREESVNQNKFDGA